MPDTGNTTPPPRRAGQGEYVTGRDRGRVVLFGLVPGALQLVWSSALAGVLLHGLRAAWRRRHLGLRRAITTGPSWPWLATVAGLGPALWLALAPIRTRTQQIIPAS